MATELEDLGESFFPLVYNNQQVQTAYPEKLINAKELNLYSVPKGGGIDQVANNKPKVIASRIRTLFRNDPLPALPVLVTEELD